ncbi:TSUP family transporter [Loktanella sp. DJP18]|uniref:TSUP family transporter n=1 Tax=Loktanella sp. DJP18 TaxID=3409788 RepID=UPI003BB601C3
MTMSPEFWLHLALCIGALVIGGVLKGATGAGAPIVAVPVISLFYGVQSAIVAMVVSNLLSNVLQGWRYRADLPKGPFVWTLAGGGLLGAALGTVMLAHVAPDLLLQTMAVIIMAYIVFRVSRPDWGLSQQAAGRLALPVGVAGGLLQGATGISAPVSISFVNALRMPRAQFVATVSLFFSAMTLAQIPFLVGYGILTLHGLVISTGAFLVILAAMPAGEALARRLSAAVFDRLILALLGVIVLKILI